MYHLKLLHGKNCYKTLLNFTLYVIACFGPCYGLGTVDVENVLN
jgi:hypothetical protein